MRKLVLFGLLSLSPVMSASPYDPLIDNAARRHGVNPIVLRAVVQKESSKRPWTFNCDGEGFYFNTKEQAVLALWQLSKHPWMVKIVTSHDRVRRFFQNEAQALAYLNSYRSALYRAGKGTISVRTDDKKEVLAGEGRIRQLWLINTDIGIAQVNYRFHGADKAVVQKWFDPTYNLDYAASLIAKHKRRGKSDLEAAGDYHSKTPSVRAKYLNQLKPIYVKEKALALPALAIN